MLKFKIGRARLTLILLMALASIPFGMSPASADASQDNECERGRVCFYNNRDRSNGYAEYVWDDKNYANNTFNASRCGVRRGQCKLNDSIQRIENRGANNDVCHYDDRDWGRFALRTNRGWNVNWNNDTALSSHRWFRTDRNCPGS